MKYCKNCGKLTIIKKDRYECDCGVVYPKAIDTVIVYNDYPPECYGNLKKLCDSKKVSYSTFSKKKFPFLLNDNEVFKVELKRGEKKEKKTSEQHKPNNEAQSKPCNIYGVSVSVCPKCQSKDVRPYRDHLCCYDCGEYFKQTEL